MKTTLIALLTLAGAMASAEVYKIDTAASKIEWLGGKKTGSSHNGEVKIKSGEVTTDAKNKVTGATVVADMKSISNIDLKDKPDMQGKLVGHLSSDDFFAVGKHPEATFKFTSATLKAGSKDEYTVKGDLTFIGKTNPIEFPAKMTVDKGVMNGTAKITIERLKWGLQYGSGNIFKTLTADKVINDTFDMTLTLVARK